MDSKSLMHRYIIGFHRLSVRKAVNFVNRDNQQYFRQKNVFEMNLRKRVEYFFVPNCKGDRIKCTRGEIIKIS